jgi:release factor glutamine methyltransferase
LLLPQATVFATDLSPAALEVARLNAERLGASPVAFCQGDLLAALPADCRVDLLVANLPYIACDDLAKLEVARWEPRLALDGGPDGLDLIRRLLKQAPAYLNPGGLILLEIGADQGIATRQLGRDAFPTAVVSVRCDLAGLDRLVCIDLAGDHGDFGIGSTCTDEI